MLLCYRTTALFKCSDNVIVIVNSSWVIYDTYTRFKIWLESFAPFEISSLKSFLMVDLFNFDVMFSASPASGKIGLRMMTTLHEEPGRRNDDDSHSEPESAPNDDMNTPRSNVSSLLYFEII